MTASKGLSRPIRLTLFVMNMQALVARSTGICRVNQHQFYTKFNALICQEKTQLVEAPGIASPSLSFCHRQLIGAFPDAR